MLEHVKYQSNIVPEDFSVRSLGNQIYEIVANSNVQVSNVSDSQGNQTTMYDSNMVILRVEIKNRSDAIVSFIRLKYSSDDEVALINKGIADKDNIEYVAYRQYVSWCKEQASVYFGL